MCGMCGIRMFGMVDFGTGWTIGPEAVRVVRAFGGRSVSIPLTGTDFVYDGTDHCHWPTQPQTAAMV